MSTTQTKFTAELVGTICLLDTNSLRICTFNQSRRDLDTLAPDIARKINTYDELRGAAETALECLENNVYGKDEAIAALRSALAAANYQYQHNRR